MTTSWQLPEVEATGKSAVVRTGPSGVLLGRTHKAQLFVRFFRPQGTRVFLGTPEYATWLVCFRAVALGAHFTIVSPATRQWRPLAEAINRVGGTVELLDSPDKVPGGGRPYRPSFVLHVAEEDSQAITPGAWQTVAVVQDISSSQAVQALRSCDVALFGKTDAKAQENVRRAYVLNQVQIRQATDLTSSDVVLAMPRRITKISMPPGPAEYRLLFNG